jgi:outer membrane immunogenic protein
MVPANVFRPVCPPGNSFFEGFGYNYRQIRRYRALPRSFKEVEMKKLILALAAIAAFSGSALAADLPARAPMYQPPAPAYNWTGFYFFGGAGGGVWDANTQAVSTVTGICQTCVIQKQGGDGWFGTVGAGYDWQFGGDWVAGIFADGQFGSLKGTIQDQVNQTTGFIKNEDNWAVGVRLGYLVAPTVYSYVNGGYSGANWNGTGLVSSFTGAASGVHTNSFTQNGWFIGGGVENKLALFGFLGPNWFMKTEYRAAYYNSRTINELVDGTGALAPNSITFKPLVQTISTSLVYRFNWGGPVVARY